MSQDTAKAPPVKIPVNDLSLIDDDEAIRRLSTETKRELHRYFTEKGRVAHIDGLMISENPLTPLALTKFGRQLAASWNHGWQSVTENAAQEIRRRLHIE